MLGQHKSGHDGWRNGMFPPKHHTQNSGLLRPALLAVPRNGDTPNLAAKIKAFQFRDIRPEVANETDSAQASKRPGHTDKQITLTVHQRIGETMMLAKCKKIDSRE